MKLLCVGLIGALSLAARAAPSMDLADARAAIAQARRLCEADGGRLWKTSLCGPILIVDPTTRDAVASNAGAGGHLEASGDVFVGRLPNSLNVANTALDWDGTHWTVLTSPLPNDPDARGRLLMHESWHRIQDRLGLPASNPSIAHLDTLDGRIRMRLEWRALAAALSATGEGERHQAIADALAFRVWRRLIVPNAAADENSLELNEGLAEYTGRKLGGGSNPTAGMVADLAAAESADSFVRSFAYHSGPAYGLLLDKADPGWRQRLASNSDLGAMLASASGLQEPSEPSAAATIASARYGSGDIVEAEEQRDTTHRTNLAAWKAKLVDGPVLTILFVDMHIQFNPNTLTALPCCGTVYPSLRVSDRWGVLEAKRGALVDAGWTKVQVAAPTDIANRHLAGDGWTLALAEGWSVVQAERAGDYTVKKDVAAGPH